jgi:hypothetical protein
LVEQETTVNSCAVKVIPSGDRNEFSERYSWSMERSVQRRAERDTLVDYVTRCQGEV